MMKKKNHRDLYQMFLEIVESYQGKILLMNYSQGSRAGYLKDRL